MEGVDQLLEPEELGVMEGSMEEPEVEGGPLLTPLGTPARVETEETD